eukprot:15421782-Alexandrium_andersonii.AAC.1
MLSCARARCAYASIAAGTAECAGAGAGASARAPHVCVQRSRVRGHAPCGQARVHECGRADARVVSATEIDCRALALRRALRRAGACVA